MTNKHLVFCHNPKCDEVLDIRQKDKSKRVKCPTCKKSTCPSCKQAYHGKNMDCEKKLDKQLKSALTGVDFHTCPQCGANIEKDGGCSMMYCAICYHRWCWICGFEEDSWFHGV